MRSAKVGTGEETESGRHGRLVWPNALFGGLETVRRQIFRGNFGFGERMEIRAVERIEARRFQLGLGFPLAVQEREFSARRGDDEGNVRAVAGGQRAFPVFDPFHGGKRAAL